ncbi:MAG: DNA methyltransferase, partial [Anaerolineales bacterium]|nr:DNA methyltransferase [Anaerolineales bacterium]
PPYSGHSSNKGEWIRRQIEAYKVVDGQPLGEKNPKWLQDDYVKFLRFSQWKIEQAGRGVVGMITNHSYLDNPTFRGMRQSLMDTFDHIFVLDLHGNSLKRETSPDGSPDENVFDIRQGVAIVFLVKTGEKDKPPAEVHQADLWGTRKEKYEWLEGNDFSSTPWEQITPRSNFYLFVPRDEAEQERYNTFTSVTDIFQKYSVGIVTARDRLTIHWTSEEAWNTVLNFSRLESELAREAYKLGKDARDWKVALAQEDLKRSGLDRDLVVPILYRPFDVRYTYYTGRSRGFICMPRPEIMRQMFKKENLALMTCRQLSQTEWSHAMVSDQITDDCMVSNMTRERGYLLPLYIHPDLTKKDLFSDLQPNNPQPNLDRILFEKLGQAFATEPSPEEIIYYIYAVLYAPYYREKYVDFLRGDFPRIPFPSDRDLFQELARSGARLADLHLLRSPELDAPQARFHGQGDNRVGKNVGEGFYFDPPTERLHINPQQYFAPLPLETWEYQIGGYQVCAKWLKDRRGRTLSLDEVRAYCRIVTALNLTITIQEEIDGLYSSVEKEILEKLL